MNVLIAIIASFLLFAALDIIVESRYGRQQLAVRNWYTLGTITIVYIIRLIL